ncbi:ABC transporter substrate-binding protein/permease [Fundicoccus culcitae]|uniref:ABC transporter substrate-binding protein/permease n=1 Tax=Fundicoccus culcitae TaxID=2969821 RepID=A0ABY5P862_9LACT|nr:ABC transporter substrate-binding protein/permease [Fundicoccus culcitae]UUX34922.1 ABC transporter substrate-binding protein/permease [Fundicoccus culcitae]
MKYFKWLSLTLVVMLLTMIGAPALAQQVAAQNDEPTYVIATDTTFAPFEYQDEKGDFVGIDMDLIAAIADDQGFKYEIRPLGFNAALQAVESGQVDGMIAGMSITDARRETFDFSDTYFSAGVQFAVLDDSEFQSLEDLAGENVAVKTGTQGMAVAESVADDYGFTLTAFEDSVNMYEDLLAGNSVAVIEDYPVMAYAAETGGIPLRFIGEQMEVADYGFAVKKGDNSELIDMFNAGLSNLQASGEYDAIIAAHLGENDLVTEETVSESDVVAVDESDETVVVADPDTTYVIGTDTTFAPFEFQDEAGNYVGIDMDLLAAIAQNQGFNYELRPLGFNPALQAVEAGQVDGMIAGMSITDARRESFDFSDTYFSAGVQFAVLDDSEFQTLEDLEGENVAVKTGTQGMAVAESLADDYGFTITIFEDSVNMYEDLQAGNSVAVIEDYPVMAYAAETGGIPLRFIGEQMEVADYGFAVQKGQNGDLLALFNQGLANLKESGEYDAIVAGYLGEGSNESTMSSDTAEVVADPDTTYVIGTDTTFAPFEFQDEAGNYVGIDMDLLAAIAEDQGFEYEIRPLGFNAALQAVEAGQVDGMIAGMSITDARRESFDFSDTYFSAGVQFAVLDDSEFQTLEDLEGENVAVKTGTQGMAVAESLADDYGFTITIFEDSVNMYEDLQASNSVAVIEDYPVMAYAAETGGIPLRFIGEQMEVADYGFAVQKGQNSDLLALFNQGLSNLQASGEYDAIIANYLGEDTTASTSMTDATTVIADPAITYVIGTDTTFAPFEFQDENGDYVGIDMDLLAAIAEDQGFEYEIRPLGFNAALQAVEAGQVDGMIAGMSITDARRESFDFSDTYFSAGVQFAVLDDSEFQTLEDLEGENVAVKTGTQGMAVAESLADDYGFTITIFEDSVNMYEDLQASNSVAVIEDYPVMAYAAETGGIPLRFIGEQLEVADYGFAVQKGQNSDLLTLFNQGLSNIQASGEYDDIVETYLGESEEEAELVEETTQSTNQFVSLIQENGKALMNGLWTTLWVTLVSFAIAAVLGVVIGLMRTSDNLILSIIAQIYIDIMRGMPLIVLAFFIYFGFPQLTGLQFGAYTAGITTLSLNAAAYIAEIVRGGINAVDIGQAEAARSLGLNQSKTMRRVILPQAFRIMIPSFINQFVITLKDTSILSVIGLVELTQTGRIIIARTYQSGAMWLIIGLMYIILITILTKISNRLEKEL